ncbi:50S ribosomal protein L4, partial [Patescibacteria group bacterium]
MPTTDIYTIKGLKKGKVSLPSNIFAGKINPALMAQAIRVYLSNQRMALAKVKSRGEVSFSTRKIYKQKGTGRARHGGKGAPIFVKGGRAHGPTGTQNFKLKLSKKMKKLSLFSALTSKFKENEIMVIDGFEKIEPKTKEMIKVFKNLKLYKAKEVKKEEKKGKSKKNKLNLKVLIVLPKGLENIVRAGRNIPQVKIMQAKQLNTYKVLNGGKLLI